MFVMKKLADNILERIEARMFFPRDEDTRALIRDRDYLENLLNRLESTLAFGKVA